MFGKPEGYFSVDTELKRPCLFNSFFCLSILSVLRGLAVKVNTRNRPIAEFETRHSKRETLNSELETGTVYA
jgi:hypothetical protein